MSNSYYRAAVGAFVVNKQGQFLVILKHNYVNKWNIVKGGIEKGETEIEALNREIGEELGILKYKILVKSKISSVVFNLDVATSEYVGQARNNYWVLIDDKQKFDVPNAEIEKFKWIKIESKAIREHFGVHDEEGVLQTFLPIEWKQICQKLQL